MGYAWNNFEKENKRARDHNNFNKDNAASNQKAKARGKGLNATSGAKLVPSAIG